MYLVTIKDNSYNKITFRFSDFDLMAKFVRMAVLTGDNVSVNIVFENPLKPDEPQAEEEGGENDELISD